MPFKKGRSGNPGGRPQTLMWRNALSMALTSKTGKPLAEALADVAAVVVDGALAGDFSCIREIGDRVDGRSPQTIAVDSENPLVVSDIVIRFEGTESSDMPNGEDAIQ